MAKQVDKKFGWVIKDFSSLQSEKCCSVPVLISNCKWRLLAFPKGNNSDYFSLYLDVADFETLPCGWRRIVNFRLTIVNHLSKKLSILKETEHCFDGKSTTWGFPAMLPLSKLHDEDAGFLVNGEVMIVAELDVLEVIGTIDASEKSEDASELVSKKKEIDRLESNDLLKKTLPLKETNNVNGTKQVENSVKTSPKNKRMWVTFLIIVFLLIGALRVANEERLAARKTISVLEKLCRRSDQT